MTIQSRVLYKRSNSGGDESKKLLDLLFHERDFGRVGLVVQIHPGAYGYGLGHSWLTRYGHGREGVLARQDKY